MNATPKIRRAPSSYQTSGGRVPVLVLMHHDGFVEVYAGPNVDARVVNIPFVGTRDGEIVADDYVRESLPRPYQDIYLPGMVRAAEMLRTVRPSELAQREYDLDILRSLDRLDGRRKEATRVWTL